MEYLRIWTEMDITEIREHLIIAEDISGHCPNCKKIGIELKEATQCPSCGRDFKYVTSKDAQNNRVDIVSRLKKKLPDLIFVDYNDYQRIMSKKNAKDLFNI